ncbi:adenosylcobinamide-phosphate synthase CbiB [Lyngbya confervoides]|uniref:Cobalamin biosynthesis protein CobD n=1 Tax=Lyngbya confervoides BDU141951 TaxID=1574623 RepID=A0ABD4T3H0_9CYAN|nr:adenosylcobinamide-phosphate synthase CbiB [Lyngbya confervoides]MCM1983077.1 adenosylcobinamide-phosphate synthase CbiB [Lyngbya confervoides BDU141951]
MPENSALEFIGIFGGAALLDYVLGDPWALPHPVQVMGWGIQRYQTLALSWLKRPRPQRIAGIGLTLLLTGMSGLVAWGILAIARQLSPWLYGGCHIVILASCWAGRSLRQAAEDVLLPLGEGNLDQARSRLRLYVGRDTEALEEAEILRAVLETVAENSVDGVMAPLFYGLVGAIVPGLGAAPLAIAYKAVSTLDSMVGYREPPWTHLGWCSARTDDILTWMPCRLTVLTLALISGHPRRVWQLCQRDGPRDPSPNSGWSECAYAASLGVQLGGTNRYRGRIKQKPRVGEPHQPITPEIIRQGLHLTRTCFILWIILALGILGAWQWRMTGLN